MNIQQLKQKVKKFPARPGIYFFKNAGGEVIYIGKAGSLRDRVRSYFLPSPDLKVQNILSQTADIDYLLVSSDKEASFIENNYIQFYRPRFNLRLKDDKSFPFLRLTVNEEFPGLYLCRRVEDDGAKYFGPFSPADEARKLISFTARIFGIRTCENTVFRNRRRPCLEYDLKMCSGPCVGLISAGDYREKLSQALMLLEGKRSELLVRLKDKMNRASTELRFEEAARWRDALKALENLKETQRVISTGRENLDIVGFNRQQEKVGFLIFHMREGRIRYSTGRLLTVLSGETDEQVLARFLKQFYSEFHTETGPPETILLPFKLSGSASSEILKVFAARGHKSALVYPNSKKRKVLLELAGQNAALLLAKEEPAGPLAELQETLALPRLPRRIEGFDISTTAGTESVGSLVVFIDGQPARSEYRKYKIRTVSGPDDYASLKEVLERRLKRLLEEKLSLPDLIFVDGGKGQLNLAREVLNSFNLTEIPVCSLAKREEIIFSAVHPEGLRLDPTSPALKLLQHIRDEAHRLAIGFHRRRRQKASLTSELDGIRGLGPARKKKLLQTFGNVAAIRQASEEELTKIVGVKLAARIKRQLS
ncbi:MAG: excinuclease ABC subunit UvrC [Candidatus Saccharicenans sp.]|nr:excinuclease ABC subunit UvrC [Candidatus Saccharicenans sp.]